MSHLKHEVFVSLFGSQMKKLDGVDCPKKLLSFLAERYNKLWEEVRKIKIPELPEEYYSFIPVIPSRLVPIKEQLAWIGINEVKEVPCSSIDYGFGEQREPYFITSISIGNEYIGTSQLDAQKSILKEKRIPLSDVETIALCLFLNEEILGKQIEALGVRYLSEGLPQVPFIDQHMTYFGWSEFSDSWTHSSFPSRRKIIV